MTLNKLVSSGNKLHQRSLKPELDHKSGCTSYNYFVSSYKRIDINKKNTHGNA